jgi:ferredoxin
MIDGLRRLLVHLGVPAGQIRHEVFEAAVAAASGRPPGEDAPRGRASHRMTCARTGKAVPVGAGQTLLDAAEQNGVPIDSLCRAGVCGTCRIQVREGEVDCGSTTLDAGDVDQGFVLACVTTVKGDCTVEL